MRCHGAEDIDEATSVVTAIEAGILNFEAAFLPYMLAADGRPLLDRAVELLPKPDVEKVTALPGR